jgi:hypothetical protein
LRGEVTMSKVYNGLLYQERGYEEYEKATQRNPEEQSERVAELGEAIRREVKFDAIRFIGDGSERSWIYIATNESGEWYVIANYDWDFNCADVRYVLMVLGTHVCGVTDIIL